MFFAAYQPIIDSAANNGADENFLDNGTYRQLSEAFARTGATGDTLRKCVAFFLLMAHDADLQLSPHFNARGTRSAAAPRRRRVAGGKTAPRLDEEDEFMEPASQKSKFEVLMEKFPAFNPEWSPEVQAKWFDAFERIQKAEEKSDS